MRRLLLTLGFLVLLAGPVEARARTYGWCEQGGHAIITNVSSSVQQSFPSCTVTVYLTGTLTLATIYGDVNSTLKANPFTADSTGYWFFYADDGRYDVRMSGGGITSPFTLGDYQVTDAGGGYANLLQWGAICDGVTNINSAVAAAISAGIKQLFLPGTTLHPCLWNPPGNTIPAGVEIRGQDYYNSRIWATNPTTTYLMAGAGVVLEHLNVNELGCNNTGPRLTSGCPVVHYDLQDDSGTFSILQIFPFEYSAVAGHSPVSAGLGLNSISVTQLGDGGGIYAQFLGGQDHSSGSAAQFQTAFNGATGQALAITRVADGRGVVLADLAGSEGTAHPAQPAMAFSTGVKVHGDNIDMFQATSTWDGIAIYKNFGATGGTFVGTFDRDDNAGVTRYARDYQGNVTHRGLIGLWDGASVASGAVITITGNVFQVTGAGAIQTINFPLNSNFPTTTQGTCIHLAAAAGSSWTLTTGGNIAATAAFPGVGHQLEVCWESVAALWYPR